jgi:uncharacterized protein (TIGR02001 family)
MRHLRILVTVGLLAAAGAAQAGVSSTWTLTNDYDFRGNSQSSTDPAIQASLDYAADGGWYIGAWASNVDFGPGVDVNYELDLYTGFTKSYDNGFGWDAGLIYYTYPDDTDFNYFEIYGSVTYNWFKGKIWYSDAFGGDAAKDVAKAISGTDKVSAWYVEGNGTFPLPANLSLLAHVGYSTGDYWDNAFGDDQLDWSVGVGYTVGHFNLGLKWVDTDGDVKVKDDAFNNEGRVIFTVATTFPWRNE